MTEKDDPTISCTHLMVKLSVLAGRKTTTTLGRRGLKCRRGQSAGVGICIGLVLVLTSQRTYNFNCTPNKKQSMKGTKFLICVCDFLRKEHNTRTKTGLLWKKWKGLTRWFKSPIPTDPGLKWGNYLQLLLSSYS